MTQPKAPPLSIRPGDVRLEKIDAYAVKRGLKRHAAVLELVDAGLAARADLGVVYTMAATADGGLEVKSARSVPAPVVERPRPSIHFGPVKSAPGSRSKGKK